MLEGYPPKVWDERGRIWRIGSISNSIFPTRPRFLRLVYDHSQRIKTQIYTVREVSVRRWWIPLITNPLYCWAPVPLSQINAVSLSRQIRNHGNLGQTSGEYPIYISKIWDGRQKVKSPIIWDLRDIWRRNQRATMYQSLEFRTYSPGW